MIEYGIVDEDAYDAQNGILIVLKEANDWSAEDFQDGVTLCGLCARPDRRHSYTPRDVV